jgi:hypothetical protein
MRSKFGKIAVEEKQGEIAMSRLSVALSALIIGGALVGTAWAQTPSPMPPTTTTKPAAPSAPTTDSNYLLLAQRLASCRAEAKKQGYHFWNRGKFVKKCMARWY